MFNRRKFIKASAFGSAGLLMARFAELEIASKGPKGKPFVVSTWPNIKANEAAWEVLSKKGKALDAVVTGVQIPEADPKDNSVGYGGLPDRDGKVTLDSCVMDEKGNCGAVMMLEHILHPVLVARAVMEKTPHVQLVGEGALQFALSQGFQKTNLLTPEAEKAWRAWLKTAKYNPMITATEAEIMKNEEKKEQDQPWPYEVPNHDTIGMVAMDDNGDLSGACTTSGLAFKMRGRVGDSPIIGAGLFVDNEVGAATATGVGEEMVRICGSHTVVEAMRHGASPDAACKEAIRRVIKRYGEKAKEIQVAFLAINNKGQHGAFAIMPGFSYALTDKNGTKVVKSKSWFS